MEVEAATSRRKRLLWNVTPRRGPGDKHFPAAMRHSPFPFAVSPVHK